MKNTTFVSAGAGSGKTYRLTQDIARMVSEGECQAEEIILTTFTDAAAKELREKVRSTLYSKGLYDAAMNIDNAAIGTIHSIAYQFVSSYWYLLGISANVSIMDTEGSKFCISQSLASLPTENDLSLFDNILKSFNVTERVDDKYVSNPDFWKKDLKNIIDKTIELCISESQLEEARVDSKKLLTEVFEWTSKDKDILDDSDIVDTILGYAAESLDVSGSQENKKSIEKNVDLIKLSKDISVNLYSIYALAKTIKDDSETKKKSPDIATFFEDIYKYLPRSLQFKKLVERYIDTIFSLAIRWKKEYEEFKRKRCLLDFGDLLQKFYELLNKKEVIDDLQSRYKVAFVDEFQDCSPLQVKSFERLSELMKKSVWVGDIKQAIYGFRGTNTERIKSIIDSFPNEKGKVDKNGNMLDSLEHCWRSNKTIVDFVNNIFCENVFKKQLSKELIKLGMPVRKESDPPAPKERELQHIHFVSLNYDKNGVLKPNAKKINNPEALADKVKELIASNTFKPNEIVVLYRNNSEVTEFTKALKERGITYNARLDNDVDKGNSDTVSSFIHAIVSFAAHGNNELSKAIIVNSIESGYTIPKLLTDRLQHIEVDGKDWLSDVEIINSISKIRETIGNQSVSAAIETLVVELNLADLIKRIDPSAPVYNYCSALETKAATYEGLCANFGLSCTLVGFVEYLKQHPIEYPGDDNGVSVTTYHKSKGLEWPCVILCSLHKAPVEAKRTYFGVLTNNTVTDTQLRLVPSVIKDLCSGIMDRFEDINFFKDIKCATINEAKHLMYVGMTRPKEQLILTTYGTKNGDNWLTSIGCCDIDSHSAASVINWGGANWNHRVENYVAPEHVDVVTGVAEFAALKQLTEHQSFDSKFVSPSKVKTDKQLYSVEQCATFPNRISTTAVDGRDSTIGNFIHHLMCLWNGDRSIVGKLAEAYGVKVDVEAVTTSIENFWKWMEETYGKPIALERELPFCFTNEKGQVVNGEIDLVYRTEKGDVLVDYKTYQGAVTNLTDADNDFYAGKYCGQIALYEEALKRDGRNVIKRLICYLSLGVIISFEDKK